MLASALVALVAGCGPKRFAPGETSHRTLLPPTPVIVGDARCEVQHELTGSGDTIDGRIELLPNNEWLVSLRMNVRLDPYGAPVYLRGLGRIVRREGRLRCVIVESDGVPGTPRFDEPVCLDEVDSLRETLEAAAGRVNANETIEVEEALRAGPSAGASAAPVRVRRRRLLIVQPFAQRAELSRDPRGRVTRVREEGATRRELITVAYGDSTLERCLPEP